MRLGLQLWFSFFFFNDTATTEIYTLSYTTLFRSLAGERRVRRQAQRQRLSPRGPAVRRESQARDRKSTRLNSSHGYISYAVFCLKKKKPPYRHPRRRHA